MAPHVSWKRPFNHVSAAVGGSEQQMPRHPTAINPPTGRQPAALSLHHHHGDGTLLSHKYAITGVNCSSND